MMGKPKLVRIVPVAPYPGADGYPYSQVAPNVEQELDETRAAELVASGAFRYARGAPPFLAETSEPTGSAEEDGPFDSEAVDPADERSDPA